jgi:hypothetical protein
MYHSVTLKMEVKDFSPATAPKGGGGVNKRPSLATLHAHTNGYTEGPEAKGF